MINCRRSGIIAAANVVNKKVQYAAERAFKNNSNSKMTKEISGKGTFVFLQKVKLNKVYGGLSTCVIQNLSKQI